MNERIEKEKELLKQDNGYELIYPAKEAADNEKYEMLLKKANNLWDDFTTGNKNKRRDSNLEGME